MVRTMATTHTQNSSSMKCEVQVSRDKLCRIGSNVAGLAPRLHEQTVVRWLAMSC